MSRLRSRPDRPAFSAGSVTDGAPSTSGSRYLLAGVAFLGLAAVATGGFLPAADTGSVPWERLHDNSLRASGIAWLTVALCVVVGAALAVSLYRGRRTLGPLFGGLLVLAETAYIGAAELTTCPLGAAVVDGAVCETASPGIGLFVLAAGAGVLGIVGPPLAALAPIPPKPVAETRDAEDRLPAQDAPESVDPSSARQGRLLEQFQQALLARDGRVHHEAEFKGFYLYVTETAFVATGRSHNHGFELLAGEWVPFTPDTQLADLEWILTLAEAAEWNERAELQARPA
jgi:hypothetical protein